MNNDEIDSNSVGIVNFPHQKLVQKTFNMWSWKMCLFFLQVLFPLLTKLLENINIQDPSGMEETRMRASTLLCKVNKQQRNHNSQYSYT